jgi:hypothetical protein
LLVVENGGLFDQYPFFGQKKSARRLNDEKE